MYVYPMSPLKTRRTIVIDKIEPTVPMMPRERRTDGGERGGVVRRGRGRKTFDDPEFDAPMVPDLR